MEVIARFSFPSIVAWGGRGVRVRRLLVTECHLCLLSAFVVEPEKAERHTFEAPDISDFKVGGVC